MQFSIKQIIKVGLYGLAVLVSLLPILNPFNAFSSLQNYSFDTFQQLFPREVYEDDPVVIVDIDDRSLGIGWPVALVKDDFSKTHRSNLCGGCFRI